jgi:hypothetical protein
MPAKAGMTKKRDCEERRHSEKDSGLVSNGARAGA